MDLSGLTQTLRFTFMARNFPAKLYIKGQDVSGFTWLNEQAASWYRIGQA